MTFVGASRRALGDLLLDQPELADCLAERLAFLGVANPLAQCRFRRAQHRRAQLVAADVQHVERDVVALANLAQQVRRGNLAVNPGVPRSIRNAVSFSSLPPPSLPAPAAHLAKTV